MEHFFTLREGAKQNALRRLKSPDDLARCAPEIIEPHYLHNATLVGEPLRYPLADALHLQDATAQQLRYEPGGGYLFPVKGHQLTVQKTLASLFVKQVFPPRPTARTRAFKRERNRARRSGATPRAQFRQIPQCPGLPRLKSRVLPGKPLAEILVDGLVETDYTCTTQNRTSATANADYIYMHQRNNGSTSNSVAPLVSRLPLAGGKHFVAGFGLLVVGVAITVSVLAGSGEKPGLTPPREAHGHHERIFAVTHAAVTTLLVTAGSSGHQLGDLRVLPATPILDDDSAVVGRLDATLLTSSINYPIAGDEVRMSTLNFVFGEGDAQLSGSADQLIVSGSGYYPGTESTIATGSALIRPVTGGSGRFAGANGWAKSEHLADGTWRHTFHLLAIP